MHARMTLAVTVILTLAAVAAGDDPVWPLRQIDGEGKGADGVRLGDVNGDGLLDAVSAWEEAGEIRVYLHPGKAKVAGAWPKVVVGTVRRPEDAVFVDLDGDGAMDVVSCTEKGGEGISVHWAPKASGDYLKPGAWQMASLDWSASDGWMWCAPVQLDGRHGVDLVVGGKSSELVWLEAPANGRDLSAWKKHTISTSCVQGGWTMSVIPVDIDGDRDLDVVWTTRKEGVGAVRWMENPGVGDAQRKPWKEHRVGPAGWNWMLGDVGDLDGNGYPDIVAPVTAPRERKGVYLLANPGPGGGKWQMFFLGKPGGWCKGAGLADFNGDGRMDVGVTIGGSGFKWMEYDKTPLSEGWRVHDASARGGKMDLVTLYDVDGDGDTDVMSTIETGPQVVWYENPLGGGIAESDAAGPKGDDNVKWKLAHSDPLTGDWKKNWSLDGDSSVSTGSEGMMFHSDQGHHDVVWFKPIIAGDVKIEYDCTYLNDPGGTTILFIQASGKKDGQYDEDILKWQDKRAKGTYSLYKGLINYVSVSVSNPQEQIRFRQSPGFKKIAVHDAEGWFPKNTEYHVTAVKVGRDVGFTCIEKGSGKSRTWTARLEAQPVLQPGRIGIRHMNGRKARYKNFKVYTRE